MLSIFIPIREFISTECTYTDFFSFGGDEFSWRTHTVLQIKTAYLGLRFKALAGITFLQFVLVVLTESEAQGCSAEMEDSEWG